MATERRKGARTMAEIPPAVLRQLSAGEIEAATLVETLAIDFAKLLATVVPRERIGSAFDGGPGIVKRMQTGGRILFETRGWKAAATHRSDTIRGCAAYALALEPKWSLARKLAAMRPLADDSNSGVREWAWLALRGEIAGHLEEALATLLPWTAEASPNLRRFASEATRPRGVWCRHLEVLKRDPELGLPLLEPLRADPAKYVQDSVSNWLNDAAKSQPEWVEAVCARWQRDSSSAATARIVKRALRSL